MLKKTLLFFLMFSSFLRAETIYVALVPTSNDLYGIVTIYIRKCEQPEGNALFVNAKGTAKGCWAQQNGNVRVDWFDSKQPNYYSISDFKKISEN